MLMTCPVCGEFWGGGHRCPPEAVCCGETDCVNHECIENAIGREFHALRQQADELAEALEEIVRLPTYMAAEPYVVRDHAFDIARSALVKYREEE